MANLVPCKNCGSVTHTREYAGISEEKGTPIDDDMSDTDLETKASELVQ